MIAQMGMESCVCLTRLVCIFRWNELIVTYKKGTSASAVKAFDKMPSWDQVLDPLADMFKREYAVEEPAFKADNRAINRETWAKVADGKTEIELTVSRS